MERVAVQSSTVAEVGYDPATMTLEVVFQNSTVYQYFDVPELVFQELIHADSVGRFLNAQIKNNYRYVKL
jgi:hypothetical protein